MPKDHLDRIAVNVIKKAWASLLERRTPRSETEIAHFTDNEQDVGFLKDVDALNTLIEPFLLVPKAFDDPPMKYDEIEAYMQHLLAQITPPPKPETAVESREGAPAFRGFQATPYPYVEQPVDYVDSAAAVLRLLGNFSQLTEIRKRQMPRALATSVAATACSAVDFLLAAATDDSDGARWQGILKLTDPPGRYANLFFTNVAALALHKAHSHGFIAKALGPDRSEQIRRLVANVPKWVVNQYDPALKTFWMDAAKTMNQVVGVLYALELIYLLLKDTPEPYPPCCAAALSAAVKRMTDHSHASSLQTDFFHSLPMPAGAGNMYYDDRRYIGGFLALFALAKANDPNVVTEDFIDAGVTLWGGVTKEWIDETTGLWDHGRPLVCYSQDAILGMVRYAQEGVVNSVTLRENDLRSAIKDALANDAVVDAVVEAIVLRADRKEESDFADALVRKAGRQETSQPRKPRDPR